MGHVVIELSPVPEPLAACERLADLPYLIFLDSAARTDIGRCSYLSADPCRIFMGRVPDDPLIAARETLNEHAADRIEGLPPFQGGLLGYIGYDYGRVLERLPTPRVDDLDVPDVLLGLYDWVIAWDHMSGRAWLISTGMPETGDKAAEHAKLRAAWVMRRLDDQSGPTPPPVLSPAGRAGPLVSTFTRPDYLAAVERVRQYILAGDVFQVNISQRFEVALIHSPFALYQRLRDQNPAAYAAYFDAGTFQILSASPERFLRLDANSVETRPIKGTRPRDADPARDASLATELQSSEKDRAENVMIVDLLRNDLSRVCRPGTVRASELLRVESHPTVHHLVSTVVGQLEPGRDAFDLLRAAFPGGSITGTPKVRAMEIITELEPTRRAIYCGSIGYISVTGDMDTSIAIRTCVAIGERVYCQAGGGVVADSEPAAEYAETIDKVRGVMTALGASSG